MNQKENKNNEDKKLREQEQIDRKMKDRQRKDV